MTTTNSLNNSSSPFDVDNLRMSTNTLSSTNTDGDVILDAAGTGNVEISSGDLDVQAGAVVIDPGAATDSYLQFNESTTGKWRTGNDATDDSYRIAIGSALGTSDAFIINTDGIRTRPLQSSFNVTPTPSASSTGDGTNYQIVYDTANLNVGSDFNLTTGIYTAPVDGIYLFSVYVITTELTSSHTSGNISINSTAGSGTSEVGFKANYAALRTATAQGTNWIFAPMSTILRLSSGDEVDVKVQVSNGTKVVDVFSMFSGVLIV